MRVCEVARAGKFFVRRMLNQLGLPPVNVWQEKFCTSRVSRRVRLLLTLEFHADVEFWRLLLEGVLGSPVGALHGPLYSFCSQSYSRTLWSDASGDVSGGYCLQSGAWRRVDFDEDVRHR